MKKNKIFFLQIALIIVFIINGVNNLQNNSTSNIFYIKFYTYNINISSSIIKDNNPLKIWSYNELYSIIQFGENKKNLYVQLVNDDYGFYIIEGYGTVKSEYNASNSGSYKKTSNNNFAYKGFHLGVKATEHFYLQNEKKEEIKIEDFNIVVAGPENQTDNYFLKIQDIKPEYNKDYEIHNIYFSILGLELTSNYRYEILDNFIIQLKKKKYINNYYWSLQYDKNNNLEGNFIIGKLPDCNNNEDNYRESKTFINGLGLQWTFSFREIFFNKSKNENDENQIFITKNENTMNAIIDFNYGLITAPVDYYRLIKKHFFDYYLNNSICYENKVDLKVGFNRIFFYCDTDKFNDKDMINFPKLYFYHSEFDYYFCLNYKDLFKIYDNYVYFLIVFDKYTNIWTLGKIFLYDKVFYFNHETKMIGFCRNFNNNEEIKKSGNSIPVVVIVIIIIIAALIFLFVIYLIIKNYKKKRHIRNNELEFEICYDK